MIGEVLQLDPELVRAFASLAGQPRFWAQLESTAIDIHVAALAPEEAEDVDDDYLDAIAAAFGKVIDAKSPFTAGHSVRVADYAARLGERLGVLPTRLRRLRRAADVDDVQEWVRRSLDPDEAHVIAEV